jgi:hypothetical protein
MILIHYDHYQIYQIFILIELLNSYLGIYLCIYLDQISKEIIYGTYEQD